MEWHEFDDPEKEEKQLLKEIAQKPSAELYYRLGTVYENVRDLENAILYGKKAVQIEPDNAEFNEFMAFVLRKNGDISDSIKYWERVAELEPEESQYKIEVENMKGCLDYEEIFKHNSIRSKHLKYLIENWDEYKESIIKYFKDIKPIKNDTESINNIEKNSCPGKLRISLQKTGENAYHRAFLLKGHSYVRVEKTKERIKWLDIEVPVTIGKSSRRQCLDMIGMIGEDYVVVEMKDINGTSPFDALREIIIYALSINCNTNKVRHPEIILDSNKTLRYIPDYWGKYRQCKYLFLSGPSQYWEKWKNVVDKCREICIMLGKENIDLNIKFMEFEAENFKKQKGIKKEYKPEYKKQNLWKEI